MLNSFYIKNFRLFKALQIERLGQVNLLVGKNNSGKTCLLEALWIYASCAAPNVLRMIISEREEYWEHWESWQNQTALHQGTLQFPPQKHPARYLFHGYQWTDENEGIQIGAFEPAPNRLDILLRSGELLTEGLATWFNCQFLTTRQLDTNTMVNLWDNVTLTPKEDFIIKGLQLVDSNIRKINVTRGSEVPIVVYKDERLPLKNLGDGMTRVFHLILSLVSATDGFLLIDEFENGLHWQVQPSLWAMVFQLAEELNVQVFATTHSRDCVNGFQAAWETQEEKGSFHRLTHRPTQGAVAIPYDCETLSDTLEMGGEIR